jgi:hypothetical protein
MMKALIITGAFFIPFPKKIFCVHENVQKDYYALIQSKK